MTQEAAPTLHLESVVNDILASIDHEREREIISRRYGLHDRKQTLEQIGELLGITRERVRQLEKSVMNKLKEAAKKDLANIAEVEQSFIKHIESLGHVARVSELTKRITGEIDKIEQSRVAFLAQLAPTLSFIGENDDHHSAVTLTETHDDKQAKESISDIVKAIKKIGNPVHIKEVAEALGHSEHTQVEALATVSKKLATLNDQWGLMKWPTVNPKNIRDKIHVILKENGSHMHFNDIAKAISDSDFKRKNVTTQAIHNELIKDKRFVLVGRGIYALKEWGFKKGTVADVITEVLTDAGEPLHRDEIVKRVLSRRFVKETTILLNLQAKSQFIRTAKATYSIQEVIDANTNKEKAAA